MLCRYDDKGRKLTDWKCSYDEKGRKHADGNIHSERTFRATALSRDMKTLVTGGDDKCVRVWDVQSAEEKTLPLRGHTGGIQSISMAPG
jgi:WD40 repeat protein